MAPLAQALLHFQGQAPSPQATQQLEADLANAARQLGRAALEGALNAVETDDPQKVPAELRIGGLRYRRRPKSRHTVGSTFGPLVLRRWLYEPRSAGERCLFPLHHLLGLVADDATPALADRVGRLVACDSQREVLRALKEENGLSWSHDTLRKVGAAVAEVMGQQRQPAQVGQLIDWLRQARRRRGPYEVVLAVGRDGVHVPLREDGYHEASIATLAVYDRRGRRVGTAYLGCMPQALQAELSKQVTALLREVLLRWKGARPRLVYLSDGGSVLEGYYRGVLRKMRDPRTGQRLSWWRVLDYYHAAKYVGALGAALFGEGTGKAQEWARRMRGVLKGEGGLGRVLQSASFHRNAVGLRGKRWEAFWEAYRYLWKRRKYMAYGRYRQQGLPIGSGVTEAGCKVVVSQRMKRSGMEWGREGGQVVLTLRCLFLSRVWSRAWQAHLEQSSRSTTDTFHSYLANNTLNAA
jgi:hypothetical protein